MSRHPRYEAAFIEHAKIITIAAGSRQQKPCSAPPLAFSQRRADISLGLDAYDLQHDAIISAKRHLLQQHHAARRMRQASFQLAIGSISQVLSLLLHFIHARCCFAGHVVRCWSAEISLRGDSDVSPQKGEPPCQSFLAGHKKADGQYSYMVSAADTHLSKMSHDDVDAMMMPRFPDAPDDTLTAARRCPPICWLTIRRGRAH